MMQRRDFGAPEGSRRAFEQAADDAEAETPQALVLRTQVARALALLGAFDDTLAPLASTSDPSSGASTG